MLNVRPVPSIQYSMFSVHSVQYSTCRPRYAFDWPTFSCTLNGSRKCIKARCSLPLFLSRCAAHPSSSHLPLNLQAWCRCYLFFLTTASITMFSKVLLTSLIIGALSVDALIVPVAREPSPPGTHGTHSTPDKLKPNPKREPECELSRFPTLPY